jgi:uncharacterized protein
MGEDMPHVDSHQLGTICWVDLATTDQQAASGFYTRPFGGETFDLPMPGGPGVYRFFRQGGRDVAAVGQLPPEMAAQGVPSAWNVWVAGDADQAAERARAAGGAVAMPPMDMGPSGRMTMLTDPGDAVVGVWQAGEHRGAGVVGEPGAMTWWEVNTRAFEACTRFYGQVFGWTTQDLPDKNVNYVTWHLGETMVGGMLEMTQQWGDIPAHWMAYFAVGDPDEVAERAAEFGGEVSQPPIDTPYGRMAVLRDPTGAGFSIIKPTQPASG